MTSAGFVVAAAIVLLVAFLGVRLVWSYWKLRGPRVVTCPENRAPAGVEVHAGHAALSGLFAAPDLRLRSCSRWPERADCGQGCLAQIAAAPEDCLVRNLLARWYAGKTCAYCGNAFGDIDWAARKPALLTPGGITIEWSQVPAERLAEVLQSHLPVCWPCHLTNTFAREQRDLVLDRSRTVPGPRGGRV